MHNYRVDRHDVMSTSSSESSPFYTRIRKAVIAGETNGHGYGILSPIVQNAIRNMCDKMLRPDVYTQAEEQLKVLLADIITEVENGMDMNTANTQGIRKHL